MPLEVVTALIGLVGIIIGAIPTYLFMRQKGLAEVDKLKAETDKTKAEAEQIRAGLQNSSVDQEIDNGSEGASLIKLEDRSEHKLPLEKRLSNAKTVAFVGSSLIGILAHYKGFIQSRAETGCKFRFLLVHPEFYRGFDNRDSAEKAEVLSAIQILGSPPVKCCWGAQ